ncbi:hypothetical protein [Sphingopyxis sp.]|uniref:hypothetical protein n=1 Tax=Sphingopyxis sp. TaxID=1908224 RepID=UPI0025E2471B|nr:hypothetical protein [Sphingopyxis sp.]MBK6414109.1 hypothetical protein [Sphingopyxis sp.]
MTQINWNALQSFDIGGAFNKGMEAGQQRRREQETDNALRALVANPNDPNVVNDLARYDPRAALQIQGQQAQQMRAQQEAEARQGAVRGDPQALEALAGFNMDDYIKLDDRSKAQYKQGIETIGQLALMADTPQEWDDTVRQLAQGAPEFQKYIGRFDLRESVIAQAGQAKEFIAQNEPKYMTPAADQDLVNVRDPAALAEFQRNRAGRAAQSQAMPPPPPGFQIDGGPTPTASGNFPGS